jgi:predicted nucleotidyltransferase
MTSDLIAYAMDVASFIIQKTGMVDSIRNIILFGSAARGEATTSSDVDIFVDVAKEMPTTEKKLQAVSDAFRQSAKFRNYWKPLGIENEIQLVTGKLTKWKELKPSIVANGISLYGKFKPDVKEGRHRAFFVWENIKPNSARVAFNKKMFGHRQGKKFYSGLLQHHGGERIGKGCIVVPLEDSASFQHLFREHKVTAKVIKVLEY